MIGCTFKKMESTNNNMKGSPPWLNLIRNEACAIPKPHFLSSHYSDTIIQVHEITLREREISCS